MPHAISYAQFGGPEVLTLTEVSLPEPAAGQVRVAVRAAGVNPMDVGIRSGALSKVFPVQFPVVPGADFAGVVDALGTEVTDLAVGDEVFGTASTGAYAQYALATSPQRKPAALSWELAACLPTVGETALRVLAHLDLKAGETLLIHGAGGSVGAAATQLAVSRGVTVIGSVAQNDFESVRALGAVPVLYGEGLPDRVRALAPNGVDAVLDTAGAGLLPVSIELASGPERVITIVDHSASLYGARMSGADPSDRYPNALPELAELAASGTLQIALWRSYPLTEAATAHADLEAHRNHGKIVLLP